MKKILLLALFFVLTPHAHGAVAYATSSPETNNTGTNTGITANPINLSGTNPLLLCSLYVQTGPFVNPAITFNGASMTLLGSSNNFGATSYIYVFGLVAPTTGSYFSAVATWNSIANAKAIHCIEYTGALQSLPSVTQNSSGTGTTASGTLTTDSKANSWVAAWGRNDSNTWTGTVNLTIRSQVTGDAMMWGDSNGTVPVSAGYNQQGTWTGSAAWGLIQVEISPAVAQTFQLWTHSLF